LAGKPAIPAGPARAWPAAFVAALLLAACGSDDDPGPGGVTVGEARALDEAAEMLDEQRVPEEVLREAAEPDPNEPTAKSSPEPAASTTPAQP